MNFQTVQPPVVTEHVMQKKIELRMPKFNFEEVFRGRATGVLIDRLYQPTLGDRLRIIEVDLVAVASTTHRTEDEWCDTGRDATGIITSITMGTVNEALVSFKLQGRTWNARNEQDIHQRQPVPYPMQEEGVSQ